MSFVASRHSRLFAPDYELDGQDLSSRVKVALNQATGQAGTSLAGPELRKPGYIREPFGFRLGRQ